jgi:hypothetical protein
MKDYSLVRIVKETSKLSREMLALIPKEGTEAKEFLH